MKTKRLYDDLGHFNDLGLELDDVLRKDIRRLLLKHCFKNKIHPVDFEQCLIRAISFNMVFIKLEKYKMPHPRKNRPRKGRRKLGSKKRKAKKNGRKK